MILVVVRGRETLLRGYGENTKGNGKEPDGPSLLRLGSISKVFATELLAGMAAEGQLRLTDPLQQYAAAAVAALWRPRGHLARSRDPLRRSAARDRRDSHGRDPVHLAAYSANELLASSRRADPPCSLRAKAIR